MKKTLKQIQRLSQRAADIRQTVESLPERAAALREQVVTTVEQAKQLRTEVVASLSGAAPSENTPTAKLSVTDATTAASLRELEALAPVLAEAGFALTGVDLELGTSFGGLGGARRLRVLLTWEEDVGLPALKRLREAQKRTVARNVFSALVQAREIAEALTVEDLVLAELVVDVESGQALRIGWRAEPATPPTSTGATTLASTVTPAAQPPAVAKTPLASPGSYFAKSSGTPPGNPTPQTAAPAARATSPAVIPAPASTGTANTTSAGVKTATNTSPVTLTTPTATPLAANWRASALDRFKKMPDLGARPV